MFFPTTTYVLRWMIQASERFFSTINPLSLEWYDSFIELMIANIIGLTLPACILYDLIVFFAHCGDVTIAEIANQQADAEARRAGEQARRAEAERDATRLQLERDRIAAREAEVEMQRIQLENRKMGKQEAIARRYEQMQQDVERVNQLPIDDDTKQAMLNQTIIAAAREMQGLL